MRRVWLLGLAVSLFGCTRGYYRQAADTESYAIESERAVPIGDTQLLRPPESRLHDPNCVEFPPKPPDDAHAAIFMAYPDGIRGSSHWHKWGDADKIEYEGWESTLPRDEKGIVKLDRDSAVNLALNNSREYQSAMEDVYLSALALTLNRFEFSLHWFSRPVTTYSHFGVPGLPNGANSLTQFQNLGYSENFAAGGQLMVELLNGLFVQTTAAGRTTYGSNIVVNFVQPLLRNFGRMIRLESLTQSERDVLYAVRSFAHFRKQFWADIATNSYLNLLLQKQAIRNLQANLKGQELNYQFNQELFLGGKASVVQVDQSFNRFLSSKQAITDAEASLQNSLDNFKIQMGLPPRLSVDLDDSILNQFQLTSPELDELQVKAEKFQQARFGELNEVPTLESLKASFAELTALVKRLPRFVDLIEKEHADWGEELRKSPKADSVSQKRIQQEFTEFGKTFPGIRAELVKLEQEIADESTALREEDRKPSWELSLLLIRRAMGLADQLSNVQTRVRIYRIELPAFPETEATAVDFAHENRLDLMNAKARVTDTWRKVQVAANALKGDINLVANMNIGTDADHANPLNFAAEASRFALGLQIDTPLNRLAERNTYRQSLIVYQRSRRDYFALSDRIDQALRRDLRNLEALRQNFEISRQQVIAASRQVEGARQDIIAGSRQAAGGVGGNAATLNILNALQDLLDARNRLSSSFFSYEQLRIQTLLDMERLQVDERGYFRDEFSRTSSTATIGERRTPAEELLPGAGKRPE